MATSALELLISLKDEASAGIAELGGSLLTIGAVGTAGVVAGLAGIGGAALSSASELQAAQNQMQAQLGLTTDEASALGDVVTDVFGNNFGASISDAGAAVGELEQRLGLMGTEGAAALKTATESAFALQDVFGVDVAESSAAAATLMSEFGVSSADAFNIITAGFQGGLNSSGDFLDSIGEYSNLLADGGASAEEFLSLLQTGLAGGALGTDKAADSFKEFGIRITDGSASTAQALQGLGLNELMAGIRDGTLQAADAFPIVQEALRGIKDPVLQAQLGVALFGTQFEDLGPSAILGINLAKTGLGDLSGATDSLNAKYNDFGSLFGGIWRQVQTAILPVGTAILDLANMAMPAISAGFALIQPYIESFSAGISGVVTFISDLAAQATALTDLANAASGAAGAFAALTGEGAADSGGASWLTTFISLALGALQEAGPQFAAAAGQWIGGMAQALAAAAPGALASVSGLVVGIIGAIGAGLPGVISAAQPYAQAMLQWVVDAAPGLLTNLGGLIAQLLSAIGGALPGIVSAVAGYSAAMIEWAIAAAPGLLANLGGLIAQALGWIASQVPGIAGQLGEWALAFLAWVGPTAGQLIIAAGQIVGNLLGWIAENGPGIITTLHTWAEAFVGWVAAEAIPGLLGALAGLLGEVFGWIDSAGANLLGQAGSIGTNIINGIVAGLNAASGGLFSVIAGIIGQTLGAAESAADINSPSRLFADAIGSPIVAGVAMGIVDNVAYLVDAAATMGRVVLEEAQAFAAEVEKAIGPLLAGALQGAADYARAQISGLDLLNGLSTGDAQAKALADQKKLDGDKQKLLDDQKKLADERTKLQAQIAGGGVDPKDRAKLDTSQAKELAKLAEQQAALDAERARLQTTASQNADPEKRAAAEAKLFDLADKQAELDAQRAELATSQAEERAALMADGDAARLKAQEQLAALDAKALEFEQRRFDLHERQYQVDMAKGSAIVNQQIADAAAAQLAEARAAANQIQDPAEASKYYKTIAGFIGEEAKLRQQIASETDDQDRDRLLTKLELVRQAQDAELAVYGNAAKDRQRQRDEDLRLAGEAAKQLRDLVYYSQEDVFGQGEAISRTLGNGIVDGLGTVRSTVNGALDAALASGQAVLRPQTLSSTPPLAASSGGAGGVTNTTYGPSITLNVTLADGSQPTAAQLRAIEEAARRGIRTEARDADVRRRTS